MNKTWVVSFKSARGYFLSRKHVYIEIQFNIKETDRKNNALKCTCIHDIRMMKIKQNAMPFYLTNLIDFCYRNLRDNQITKLSANGMFTELPNLQIM